MIIQAPAKLNRFLAVLGRRADGYHELEVVTTVLDGVASLTDTLRGEPAPAFSLTLAGVHAEGIDGGESNLVTRAWGLLEKACGRSLPAALHLEKRIPHGGGLGGGSSDAAAALLLGDGLFALGLGVAGLLPLAMQLGSDVPLFLLGGTVLGLGRGERVFPMRPVPLEPMVLIHPGLHVSTPAVYRALGEVGYPFPQELLGLAEGGAPPWRNDLTGAALWTCPLLAEARDALVAVGGEPLLCGSGASWVARFPSREERDRATGALRSAHPSWGIHSLG